MSVSKKLTEAHEIKKGDNWYSIFPVEIISNDKQARYVRLSFNGANVWSDYLSPEVALQIADALIKAVKEIKNV